jgi:hypothetical protein
MIDVISLVSVVFVQTAISDRSAVLSSFPRAPPDCALLLRACFLRTARMSRRPRPEDSQTACKNRAASPTDLSSVSAAIPSSQPQESDLLSSHKRARIPGRSPCYMDQCADVELQLIMQLLSNQERLLAAKVSRRLLHAVSQPFSWRRALPFQVKFGVTVADSLLRSLLRNAPISLHLCQGDPLTVAQVAAVVNLHSLKVLPGRVLSHRFQEELLSHPAARGLQEFILPEDDGGTSTLALQRLAQLPQLAAVCIDISCVNASCLNTLATSQTLTRLQLHSCSVEQVAVLANLSSLRSLSLKFEVSLTPGDWERVFTGTMASSLEDLSVRLAHSSVPEEEYAAVFTGMKRLQSLSLVDFSMPNLLLSQLHLAPTLRELSITMGTLKSQTSQHSSRCWHELRYGAAS